MKNIFASLFLATTALFATSVATSAPVANIQKTGCAIAKNTVCLNSGERMVQGLKVSKDCWATQTVYQCAEKVEASECEYYAAKGCTTDSTKDICKEKFNGACAALERTYKCSSSAPVAGSESCGAVSYCEKDENGKETCYDMSYSPDQDMIPVVSLLEAGRQAGVYGNNTFFNADALRCRLGAFGVGQSCCVIIDTPKGRNGEKGTANSVMMKAVWSGVKYGYQYVKAWASPYVSDAIMVAKTWLTGGAQAAASATTGAAAGAASVGFNISYMGFGYATAGAAPAGALSIGNAGLYFSPMGFAIAVAVYVIMQVMMCTPNDEENKLGMLRGSNLCRDLGDYCAKETLLGMCQQRKRTFCCWNSVLAKIISEQGREQIGKTWGSPKEPNCSGFTMDEFKKLNLGKMDLSAFYAEVKANTLGIEGTDVAKEDQDFWADRAQERMGIIDTKSLDGSYGANRNEMKSRIEGSGLNALSDLDVQYEDGKEPVGNLNVHEDEMIKKDPYLNKK